MKLNFSIQIILASILSVFILGGCATKDNTHTSSMEASLPKAWLYGNQFQYADLSSTPELYNLGLSHLNAYFNNDNEASLTHLVNAYHLFELGAIVVTLYQGEFAVDNIKFLEGIAATSNYLATYPNNLDGLRRSEKGVRKYDVYILNSFKFGRDALQRIVEINVRSPASSTFKVAEARAQLADWLLLFYRLDSAKEIYSQSYLELYKAEDLKSIASYYYESPKIIPNNALISKIESKDRCVLVDSREGYDEKAGILVTLDVTAKGRSQRISVDRNGKYPESQYRRIYKKLKGTRFRPKLQSGKLVTSKNTTFICSADLVELNGHP